MTTPKDTNAINEGIRGYYRIALALLGDDMDVTLSTVLESVGRAIAESCERIETIQARYGDDAADMAAEDEIPVIEDLLGIA